MCLLANIHRDRQKSKKDIPLEAFHPFLTPRKKKGGNGVKELAQGLGGLAAQNEFIR